MLGALINRAGCFVVPLVAIYLTGERGLRPTTAGLVIAAYGFGSLLSGPLGGTLADRVGRRPTMIFAFGWSATAMLLASLARSPFTLGAAFLHLGVATDLYRPAAQAAIADVCSSEERPRAFGMMYWVVNLGFAIAAALGGTLSRYGFRWLFVADAATTLAYGAVIALFVPETRPLAAAVAPRVTGATGLVTVLRDRTLLAFMFTQMLVTVQFIQSHGALPVALAQQGIGAAAYGAVIAVNGVLIFALQPVALGVVARMRRTSALALGAVLVGVGFGLNAPALGVAGAVCSVVVWTLGEMVGSPVVPAVLADLAPLHLRARYQGMGQVMFGLCALVGPPAGLWVLEHGSPRLLWSVCCALGLLSGALNLQSAPRLRARLGGRGHPV
jgi:MFS family permease